MNSILKRIERKLGVANLVNLLSRSLSATDLQSLLLEVYRQRARDRKPADVLRDYKDNRFVRPASVHPRDLLSIEMLMMTHLPDSFEMLTLSPVAPLGTNSVVASVSQDWAMTTIRNTEVVSDATNVLALECAVRRQASAKQSEAVHLAASHRLLRSQSYDQANLSQHFQMFSLCSAGRDQGDLGFEIASLLTHIVYYLSLLQEGLDSSIKLSVYISDFHESYRLEFLDLGLLQPLRSAFPDVFIDFNLGREAGRGYYRDLCFHIYAQRQTGEAIQLADGGSVDWTQKVLSNNKERLIISGISSERFCQLHTP